MFQMSHLNHLANEHEIKSQTLKKQKSFKINSNQIKALLKTPMFNIIMKNFSKDWTYSYIFQLAALVFGIIIDNLQSDFMSLICEVTLEDYEKRKWNSNRT